MADTTGTLPPGVQDLINERDRLQGEIGTLTATSKQVDPDGSPSSDALIAQKRLDKLNDDYRSVLVALAQARGPSQPQTTSPGETTWVDVAGPLQEGQVPQQQAHRVVDGQLVPIPGLMRAKPASDTSGAPQWIPDPKNPNQEIQVVYSGTTALPVSANGAVVSRPKKVEAGAGPTATGGPRWIPDPKNPGNEIEVVTILSADGTPTNNPTGATRKAPAAAPTAAGNVIWQDIPDQPGKQQGGTLVEGKFVPVEGLTKDKDKKAVAVYGTGPNDKFRIAIDENGQVVSKEDNPNYVGEKPTQLTADLVAPNIPLLKPDGTIQWVANQNRVPANQAMLDLLEQANIKVNGGQLSMADAKDLLTGATNAMNAQTARANAQTAQQQNTVTAAGDILSNTRANAQTGAGMLQQRVQAASSTLQSILGNALSNKNLTSVPGDVGTNLVQGLGAWTADLMGGQSTMDSAARLVQMADPNSNVHDPATQTAIATLSQMLDKHQELNGVPHPAVMATQAAQQSQQTGGFAAPQTVQQGVTSDPNQWYRDWQVRQAADAQQQQIARQIALQNASAANQVPGQNYGAATAYTGGVAPWNALPGPSFIAPALPPVLANVTAT